MRFLTVFLLAASLLLAAAAKTNWDTLRSQMRQTLHVPDPLPNVADKLYGRFSPTNDVTADRVSFATDYGLRVPAIVYHQAGATITKHPALVIVNGHNGDKSSWYAYWAGILYARAGAVVLTYDPIGEFERNWQKRSSTRQHDTELTPDDMARRLSGLMITDIMQGARYLAQRPDVDPKNIAVLGYSMGSLVSSFACALDASLRACVLVAGGDLDGKDGYWDKSAKMCQGIPYQSLAFLGERGPIIYGLNAKRGPPWSITVALIPWSISPIMAQTSLLNSAIRPPISWATKKTSSIMPFCPAAVTALTSSPSRSLFGLTTN